MLRYRLTHPTILAALASAGHGSRVLISDGHYPHTTGANPAAERVYLNLAPDRLLVTEVLAALVDAIPVEAATVMTPPTGPSPRSSPTSVPRCRAWPSTAWTGTPSTTRPAAPTPRSSSPPATAVPTPTCC
jgi:L-fucose mutarotase